MGSLSLAHALYEALNDDLRRGNTFTDLVDVDHTCDHTRFASVHLARNIFKRYLGPDNPVSEVVPLDEAHKACWQHLVDVNEELQDLNSRVDEKGLGAFSPSVAEVLLLARDEIHHWLNDPVEWEGSSVSGVDYSQLANGLGVGPGSSLGVSGTSFWDKFLNGNPTYYDSHPEMYTIFKSLLKYRPAWFKAEIERHELMGAPVAVQSSKFGTVPKSTSKRRGIATEATIPMAIQLSIGKMIAYRLKYFTGMDIADQTLNQDLAQRGSENDSLSTLDLSAASDRRSFSLDRLLLPSDWFGWVKFARSDTIVDSVSHEKIVMQMTSTMGNGFTFALMSCVLFAICSSCLRFMGLPCFFPKMGRNMCNIAVYGDDIIVPAEASMFVIQVLEEIGLRVNRDKSCLTGPFRESCGADWYHGKPVRPFFVESLTTPQERVSVANLVGIWSTSIGIPLPSTYNLLLSSIDHVEEHFVPPRAGIDQGLMVPLNVYREFSRPCQKPRYLFGQYALCWMPTIKSFKVFDGRRIDGETCFNDMRQVTATLQGCMTQGRVVGRTQHLTYHVRFIEFSDWDIPTNDSFKAGRLWGVDFPQLTKYWNTLFTDFLAPRFAGSV